jgi:hypothetical protein
MEMWMSKEQLIAARAYQLWEQEGRPHGADERHWIQAVRDVEAAELGQAAGTPKAKPAVRAKPVGAPKVKTGGATRIAAVAATATSATKKGNVPAKKPKK